MSPNFVQDEHLRILAGKAITDGRYVLFYGVKRLPIAKGQELETSYIIGCTEEQASTIFDQGQLEGRLYDAEGTSDVSGRLTETEVQVYLASRKEHYSAISTGPLQYEGEWKGQGDKGTWTLDLIVGRA